MEFTYSMLLQMLLMAVLLTFLWVCFYPQLCCPNRRRNRNRTEPVVYYSSEDSIDTDVTSGLSCAREAASRNHRTVIIIAKSCNTGGRKKIRCSCEDRHTVESETGERKTSRCSTEERDTGESGTGERQSGRCDTEERDTSEHNSEDSKTSRCDTEERDDTGGRDCD